MKNGFYEKRRFTGEHENFYSLISHKNLDVGENIKYLDVGCSDGYGIGLVSGNLGIDEKNLFGVDITAQKLRTKFKFHICDLNTGKLPYANGFFDIISSFEVVEHIYDTKNYISEIRRVLKTGGYLAISTPNLAWWGNRILLLFGYQPACTEVDLYNSMYGKPKIMKEGIGAGHIHVFTKKALDEFLAKNGFKILKRFSFGSEYGGSFKIFNFIDGIMSKIPGFAKNYVYICKKI